MRFSRREILVPLAALALLLALGPEPARAQMGVAVGGVGPVNRSMGGAAVAAPLDAAGSLFWNPATIGGLGRSEMVFGTELLIPRTNVSSRIPAGSFGAGQPATALGGNSGSNSGVFPLPVFGLIYRPQESEWTYGLGFFELGGFGVNYPASGTNPVLTPQSPFGRGLGSLYSNYQVYQIAPTVSYQLTESIAVGAAANLDMGGLSVNPGLFAAPTLVSTPIGPGPVYPAATNGRFRWGGGFQAGVYFTPDSDWRFGAAIKSPQWFETYTYNSVSADGRPTTPKFNLDFPMIASVGTSYTGFERFLIATDLRFVDYRNTNGFRNSGFDSQGALRGIGWQNIFALGTGVQYQCSDNLSLRGVHVQHEPRRQCRDGLQRGLPDDHPEYDLARGLLRRVEVPAALGRVCPLLPEFDPGPDRRAVRRRNPRRLGEDFRDGGFRHRRCERVLLRSFSIRIETQVALQLGMFLVVGRIGRFLATALIPEMRPDPAHP